MRSINDVYIAVMGVTGAGKTGFISTCTEKEPLKSNHGLLSSVTLHTMIHDQKTVHLVDIPGFGDSKRPDADVLQEIAFWLLRAYRMGIRLSGIIYLHRITDIRMQGSAKRSLDMLKKICGPTNYANIVLATTRWDDISKASEEAQQQARQRYITLCERSLYWGDMCCAGAIATKLSPGRYCALKIVDHVIHKERRLAMLLQQQIVEGTPIYRTDAGKILYDAYHSELDKLREELRKAKSELEATVASFQDERRRRAEETVVQISRVLEAKSHEVRGLRIDTAELESAWSRKICEERQKFQRKIEKVTDRMTKSAQETQVGPKTPSPNPPSADDHVPDDLFRDEKGQPHTPVINRERCSKKTSFATSSTLVGVAGLGLGVLQLAATAACTIM
ncbi:hypothetical protein AOQ84DRAFT_440256 [Glonium stellatum]|uniref:G domain-containing protein n=1 Tax=Glonium stellatum TaxID=574774 RepID=A0A8E2JS28_9PEZI|nr:hypothetical protein AOQ84DRAFT_440256 [Glonium stellatum]